MRILDFADGFQSNVQPTAVGILASDISFTPAGTIASDTVQEAIEELNAEKVAKISSIDNRLTRFDGTAGEIQSSGISVDDSNNVSGIVNLAISGTATGITKGHVGLGNADNTSDATKNTAVATLTNKTLTAPVIDIASLTEQSSSPSTPSAGSKKFYAKTDGKVYTLDSAGVERQIGAGSGSGSGKNYLSDLFAGDSVTGINRYADAAATSPVDGTGGSPNITAAALNTSTPLRSTSSQRLSKGAANRQGEGWSIDFTMDSADYDSARPATIKFRYKTSSAYVSSDLKVFVYDRDGSALLNVQDVANNSGALLASSAGTSVFTGVFYPNSPNNDYRLILHITSTNASAWDFDVIDLAVGPDQSVPGAILTEWVPCSLTGSWSTNTTYTAKSRRVGDYLEVNGKISLSGAPTSAILTVTLPNGLVLDTNKLTGTTAQVSPIDGWGTANDAGTATYELFPFYNSTTVIQFHRDDGDGTVDTPVTQVAPFTFGNGDSVSFFFRVPISGWAASTALSSNEVVLSTVKVIAQNSAGTSLSTATETDVPFATIVKDAFSAWSTPNFTTPKTGYYAISAKIRYSSQNDATQYVVVTNSSNTHLATLDRRPGRAVNMTFGGSTVLYLIKGDVIKIRAQQATGGSVTLQATAIDNSLEITELPDFSTFGILAGGGPKVTVYTSGSGTHSTSVSAKSMKVRLVGGGATGSTNLSDGTPGNATTFGGLTGNGGGNSGNAAPSSGGAASGGDINIPGSGGQGASAANSGPGGQGGSSAFGGSGAGAKINGAGTSAAANSGSGGGGGAVTTSRGGGGAGGYVEKTYSGAALLSSYSYAVGAAVTGPTNAGDGAAGIIIVEEYY